MKMAVTIQTILKGKKQLLIFKKLKHSSFDERKNSKPEINFLDNVH